MKNMIVIGNYCPKNHPCPVVKICPVGAITQQSYFSAPQIDYSKCTKCGKCSRYCGYGAFQMIDE
jgi:ferredoxin